MAFLVHDKGTGGWASIGNSQLKQFTARRVLPIFHLLYRESGKREMMDEQIMRVL